MRLDSTARFLTLHDDQFNAGQNSLSISEDVASALTGWTAGTRVSPIWAVKELTKVSSFPHQFSGSQDVLFIGPVQPGLLLSAFREFNDRSLEVWITAGSLNCIVIAPTKSRSEAVISKLKAWTIGQGCVFEHWKVVDGSVAVADRSVTDPSRAQLDLDLLSTLARQPASQALIPALQEYTTLMASALTRSAYVSSDDFADLRSVAKHTDKIIRAQPAVLTILDVQSRLMSLNAALSRFTSQAFSGIPPILQTECHFWIHSLLGTGTANLALTQLTRWIGSILGEARLREQISALKDNTSNVPSLRVLTEGQEALKNTLLQASYPGTEAVVPLITYFSGRDGFSSHLQTLSAPLNTLAECNSWRSSLLTVTHEISHIFVQSVLAEIYPDASTEAGLDYAKALINPGYQAPNWHAAGAQLLLEGLVSMETALRPGEDISFDTLLQKLKIIIVSWRREAQEIMVHAFDFLYFYSSDADFYIKSIWNSWCTIPGIDERVPEYVMRTLCAISAPHLSLPLQTSFDSARREATEALKALVAAGGLLTDYATIAIELLTKANNDASFARKLREEYGARVYLVRLVSIFLFSEKLSARLFSDPTVRSSQAQGISPLVLDARPIGNPLTFLRGNLKENPSEAESLWVLTTLAFGDSEGDKHAPA